MFRNSIKGLEYGGSAHKYYWDKNNNPNATLANGLANCTTLVYGRVQEEGKPVPVKSIVAGGKWHKSLINGWVSLKYNPNNVQVGDLIEWDTHNHIAYVEKIENGIIYISGSFYTGIHGKARWEGAYDKRNFSSLKELSDWMIKNYQYRFYHYCPVETESKWCGGAPEYIVRYPQQKKSIVTPVAQNKKVNQVLVSTNEQNIRDNNNTILGTASAGYYNVIKSKKSGTYTWYEIENNKWIAAVAGRVKFIKMEEEQKEIKPIYENNKVYTLNVTCNVRKGPGTSYAIKSKSELTKDGQKHATSSGALKKGTQITCFETKEDAKGNIWMRCPSGWVAAYYNKEQYIK